MPSPSGQYVASMRSSFVAVSLQSDPLSIVYQHRFGPWFVETVICGLGEDGSPFISAMDLIGTCLRRRCVESSNHKPLQILSYSHRFRPCWPVPSQCSEWPRLSGVQTWTGGALRDNFAMPPQCVLLRRMLSSWGAIVHLMCVLDHALMFIRPSFFHFHDCSHS